MKKNKLITNLLLCFIVLSITVAAKATNNDISQEQTFTDKGIDKRIYVVDSNLDFNPIGKVVKYNKDINVKPIIERNAVKYSDYTNFNELQRKKRDEEKEAYLVKLAVTPEEDRFTNELFEFLEKYNLVYYELGSSTEPLMGINATQPTDVSVNTPFVIYDSTNRLWEVWGGFNFSNPNAWWSERPDCGGFCNPTGNIGGYDTLGINLSGGTNGAALKDFFMQALWQDAPSPYNSGLTGQYSYRVTNRVGTLDSSVGAMFLGQDSISSFGLGSDGYQKFANNFGSGAVCLKYDSKFANANGLARVYYRHTWNQTTIDSITLSSDGTFSITIKGGEAATPTLIGRDYAY